MNFGGVGGFSINQFFEMLNAPGQKQHHTKIIIEKYYIAKQHQYNSLSPELKQLYDEIFCDQNSENQQKEAQIKIENKLPFKVRPTSMPICNKILNKNQPVFRCYDCMTHQASVLCKSCFQKADHKGHRYQQISSGGGNCDCGNPDAISPKGFCTDHPGKAEPIIIDEKEELYFLQISLWVFQWIFRLHEKSMSKSSDVLGQLFSKYLIKLNEQSLYYNTLTYKLLYSKRRFAATQQKKNRNIISYVFEYGIKLLNFARKMTDMFLNMFSLQVFKFDLIVSFTEAYNTITEFQQSKFKSLYIQLFANNEIVERLLTEKKLVLCPYQRQFNFLQNTENLMFLSSIKKQVAQHFFQILMEMGVIPLQELDTIENQVEKGDSHIVEVINENLNSQNGYYSLLYSILRLVKGCQQTLIKMVNNYVEEIMKDKYSYKKNKTVMPFHKILGVNLLTLYQGDLSKINAEQLQKMLGSKYNIKQVTNTIFKLILQCFSEFSVTFFQSNYFNNYVPLYAKSGNTIVVLDMLMLIICIKLYESSSNQSDMNTILKSIFNFQNDKNKSKSLEKKEVQIINLDSDQQLEWVDLEEDQAYNMQNLIQGHKQKNQSQQQSKQQKQLKRLQQNLWLTKLLIQTCISDRSQVLLSNTINIQNEKIRQKTQKLFIEILNNFKEITSENLKLIQKYFIETPNFEDKIIKKFLSFDKSKKKYNFNFQLPESSKLPLHLYPTLNKLSVPFSIDEKISLEQEMSNQIQIPLQNRLRLRYLLNEQFLEMLTQFFLHQLENLPSHFKLVQKVFIEFSSIMRLVQEIFCQNSSQAIDTFFKKTLKLGEKKPFQFLKQSIGSKVAVHQKHAKNQKHMKKYSDKKKKKLEEIKKKQNSFSLLLQQKIQEEQQEACCIICREDDKSSGLCFLGNFKYSNNLSILNRAEGRFLVFSSCFHPIHINCFMKTSNQGLMPCPLCKSQSNIMLPLDKDIINKNQKVIKQIYERINVLKLTINQNYKGYDKEYDQFGILSLLRALVLMVGKHVIKNESFFNEKDQRLSNTIFNLIQIIFDEEIKSSSNNSETKGIQCFLDELLHKKKTIESQSTNFYAFEYITLQILYKFLKYKSANYCRQILKESQAKSINGQDLRKIWQMCKQITLMQQLDDTASTYFKQENLIKQMKQNLPFYKAPQSIVSLIKIRDQPEFSCKNGHQMCVCVTCNIKGCFQCKQISSHFNNSHCGDGLAFNLLTGGFMYRCQGRMLRIPAIYWNEMGGEWKPIKSAEGFQLQSEVYDQIKKQILNQTLKKYILQKYPDSFKLTQLQQFMNDGLG